MYTVLSEGFASVDVEATAGLHWWSINESFGGKMAGSESMQLSTQMQI